MRYTDTELTNAVKDSNCLAAVLTKLGLRQSSAQYTVTLNDIDRLQLNTAHWTQSTRTQRPLEDYLVEGGPPIGSHILKIKLVNSGYLSYECSRCGLEREWQGEWLALELDHINGNRYDNRIENLRLLCPNCHSLQTASVPPCSECGKLRIGRLATSLCVDCYRGSDLHKAKAQAGAKKRRGAAKQRFGKSHTIWPLPENILERLRNGESYASIGRELGVSDNAVRKFLKRKGFTPPKKYRARVA